MDCFVKSTEPTKAQEERMNKGITFPRVIHKKRLKTTSETIKAAINQEARPVKIGNNTLSQSILHPCTKAFGSAKTIIKRK